MEDLIIGSHVSFNKATQLVGSVEESLSYKANTFMFYTGAPQNTRRKKLEELNIPILAEDTGENFGRTVIFYPETGDFVIRAVGKPEKVI